MWPLTSHEATSQQDLAGLKVQIVYSRLEFWFPSNENIQSYKNWRGSKFKWCTPNWNFGSLPMKTFNAMRFCTLTVFEPAWLRYEIEKVYLDGLPEDGDLTGQMVVLHLQSFQVSFHLRQKRSDATFLSLKEKILFFSPLDWFGSRESSPSPLRPLVGELALLVSVKRKGLVKQKKVLTKCSKNIFCCLLSLCLFFSSCSTNQPGLLLSRDNSISGNIALLLFNCLCLQWQPFVVSFIYPKLLLLDSFCSKSLRECIQDPTISPPLD